MLLIVVCREIAGKGGLEKARVAGRIKEHKELLKKLKREVNV